MLAQIEIRQIVDPDEIERGLALVWRVFQEFVAPDYEEEGVRAFHEAFVLNPKFRNRFRNGDERMYGAYLERKLAGVLSISRHQTVSCVFVDGAYHRLGVGRALMHCVIETLRTQGVPAIRLNASPYALPFYHALGFTDTGEQTSYHGIVYTPMELLLSAE